MINNPSANELKRSIREIRHYVNIDIPTKVMTYVVSMLLLITKTTYSDQKTLSVARILFVFIS
jgi:hypothetical protein